MLDGEGDGDASEQCDSGGDGWRTRGRSGCGDDGGGLKSNGEGGDEQITGHVAQSLMQSKPAAGGITFGSWDFTLLDNITRRNQKDQIVLSDEKALECIIVDII
ncbi:hypothetical protein A4A49_01766 [Nicotiana attenuata]|uniref:Uncharacterized protein n=1 Tax=Nicotiana attenuata TaxID=49451 RepID=A0A314LCD6_NICAT|nr:hypothetical protein A4A49_01766 [Nicotiana attenuata]